ncbi:hypothetical protein pb186bvf_008706 [Paramecium bursaria]
MKQMKRRPQSALITKISKDSQVKSEQSVINTSQMIFNKKQSQIQSPPIHFYQDKEQLYFENILLKQQNNELRYENMKHKSKVAQLQKKILQIEKVDKYQLNQDALGVQQQGEGSIVPILKSKIREQQDLIDNLNVNLQNQFKSVKLTQLLEMQKEIKQYQDEILKLRQMLSITQKLSDQDLFNDPDIQQRLQNYTLIMHAQENQISSLQDRNDKLNQEIQDLQDEVQKLKDEMKALNFEKSQIKKQLDEATITENEIYQKKKNEYMEKKLQEQLKQNDQLKGELSLQEQKLKKQSKLLKEREKEFKDYQIDANKKIQTLTDANAKKDYFIQDLQERVNIVEILKQKSSPKVESPGLRTSIEPPKTYREKGTQAPENQVKEIANTRPINLERLKFIQLIINQKVIRHKLTKDRLQYIFENKQYIQLKNGVMVFQKMPFGLSESDALLLSRYFIGEDNGSSSQVNLEDTQEVSEIIKQIYDIKSKFSENITFKSIIYENQLLLKLIGIYKSNKKLQGFYNKFEYKRLLEQYRITHEQFEYLQLINFEFTGLDTIIDHDFLASYFLQEHQMFVDFQHLNTFDLKMFQYVPQKKDESFEQLPPRMSVSPQRNSTLAVSKLTAGESTKQLQVQSILQNNQILTFSQINEITSLQPSESRRPRESDLFNYSQSQLPQVKRDNSSIQFQLSEDPKDIQSFEEITRPPQLKQHNEQEQIEEFIEEL